MMIQKVKGKGSARGIFVASILMMTFFMGMIPAAVTADIVDTPFEAYATITPNIDGVISGSEWSDAAIATQTITHSAEYVQELTVAIKNDATYLYMLVQITNEDYSEAGSGADFINILFDNDNDGAIDTGENRWAIRYDGTSVVDAFNPNGVAHHSQKDTTDGGTDDLNLGLASGDSASPLDNAVAVDDV